MVRTLALVLLGVLWLIPSAGLAQGRRETAEARRLWLEGRDLAEQGDWEGALDRFERSLALVDRASTLVSIANAAVRLERPERAIEALDHLREIADPAEDAQLLEAAEQLREAADAQIAARPPPEPEPEANPTPEPDLDEPAAPVPPPRGDGVGMRVLGPSIVLGAAALTFVTAGVLFALREDAVARRDALCPEMVCPSVDARDEALGQNSEASDLNAGTNAMLVIGSIAAAAGATWLVLAFALDGGGGEVALRAAPGRLALEGRF